MDKLNIVVITTFFDERLGYQEVQYARVLARLGHKVTVYATTYGLSEVPEGAGSDAGYTVRWCGRYLNLGQTVLPLSNMRGELKELNPDVAFVLGPNHLFPCCLTRSLPVACKVVCYFGDHPMNIRSPLVRRLVKDRWYRWMIGRCDSIIAAVPPTVELLERIAGNESVREKVHHTGLFIDPEEFTQGDDDDFDFLNPESKVLATVTIVRGKKAVIPFLEQVSHFLAKNENWEFVLYGMMENEKSREVEERVATLPASARMHLQPLASQHRIISLYHRASIGAWFSETVSIQQAMMAGLPIVVPDTPTMRHLVNAGVNGVTYGDASSVDDWSSFYYPAMIEGLSAKLEEACEQEFPVNEMARWNGMVDAEEVLNNLLAKLDLGEQSEIQKA